MKLPEPKLQVVIPESYVGPLFIELNLKDRSHFLNQRLFTAAATPEGYVQIDFPEYSGFYPYSNISMELISSQTRLPFNASVYPNLMDRRDATQHIYFIGQRVDYLKWRNHFNGYDWSTHAPLPEKSGIVKAN